MTAQQVLWANFLAQTAMTFGLTWSLEPYRLPALLHLGTEELGQVFLLAFGVNYGANIVQQLCIRNLGAAAAAAFLPMRLLGSLVGSYVLLAEGLVGPAQWAGVALLLVAVTRYLLQQKQAADAAAAATAARRAARHAAAAAAAAAAAGGAAAVALDEAPSAPPLDPRFIVVVD